MKHNHDGCKYPRCGGPSHVILIDADLCSGHWRGYCELETVADQREFLNKIGLTKDAAGSTVPWKGHSHEADTVHGERGICVGAEIETPPVAGLFHNL